MEKGLISEELNNSLSELVGELFAGNRILDRMMSILSVKFVMNKTALILHSGLAHKYPLLADKISTYQASRNNLTSYPETPLDDSDYESPLDAFNKFLTYMRRLEGYVSEVIIETRNTNDLMTEEFLTQFLLGLNKYTEQALLLVDKGELYINDWMSFDERIENFYILDEMV